MGLISMNFLPRALSRAIILFLWLAGLVAASPDSRLRVPVEPLVEKYVAWGNFDNDEDKSVDRLVLTSGTLRLWFGHEQKPRLPSDKLCLAFQRYARSTSQAVACDTNNDGLPDLVLLSVSQEIIAVFRNLGRKPGDAGKPGDWRGFAEAPKAR